MPSVSRNPFRTAVRTSVFIAALAVASLSWSAVADARLAHSKFSRLLRDSELICRVRVTEVHVDPKTGAGFVLVEVLQVLKGKAPASSVRIEHIAEVHEMRMTEAGEQRLLFLRRQEGKWTGTQYGRSYWPLVPAAEAGVGLVSPVTHPITMIRFDGRYRRLLRPARLAPHATGAAGQLEVHIEQMIPLAAVERALER